MAIVPPVLTGVIRTKKGRFAKGCSGNLKGRPSKKDSILDFLTQKLILIPDKQERYRILKETMGVLIKGTILPENEHGN